MIAKHIRFLILRGGAIGDFVMTLPALQAIRERWPEAHIELIGYPHIAELALEAGLADKVDSLDRAGIAAFFASRPMFTPDQVDFIRSFDLIFTWLHDVNGAVQANLELAGAKQVVYGSPIVPADCHAADHLVKPLERLAMYIPEPRPSLSLSPARRSEGKKWLADRVPEGPVWALHPGSGSAKKNWPAERFVALADRIEKGRLGTALFLFGEADEPARAACAERIPPERIWSHTPLRDVARVLSACSGYVGNDSGITHLAAALEVPVIALFGPSSPRQWGPRGQHVAILTAADSDDMRTIELDRVWEALLDQRARQ